MGKDLKAARRIRLGANVRAWGLFAAKVRFVLIWYCLTNSVLLAKPGGWDLWFFQGLWLHV